MKSFSVFTAVLFIALGSTVRADDPAPVAENLPNVDAEQYDVTDGAYVPPMASSAYRDFPGYGPGFTSYRGLGFMGSCCEQTSCCAQNAWDGYCESKTYGPTRLFHGWADKLHGCLPKSICCPGVCCPPAKCAATACGQKGCPESSCCDVKPWHGFVGKWGCGLRRSVCDPCGDACYVEADGKCGDIAPKCRKPLCDKLHCLRGHWGNPWRRAPAKVSGECCEPIQGKQMWMPTETQSPQAAPVPEPTVEPSEELPPPEVTTDYVPDFPDYATPDRSATRFETRRLPNAFMSF